MKRNQAAVHNSLCSALSEWWINSVFLEAENERETGLVNSSALDISIKG